ncbi:MAG: hypothetical protein KAS21_03300 [Candidatus Aminicenantes bacterium]|nr:hypothetical protein [Candidatus Aminicenantes bacterium]
MYNKLSLSIVLSFFVFITILPGQTIKATAAGYPDLMISNFWNWPKNPTSREWFDIKVRVYNISNTALANQTELHIFVGGSGRPYIIPFSSLGANKSRDFIKRVFLDVPGKYVARAVVDPENKIMEIKEDNNTRQLKFSVRKAGSSEYLPDLTISSPSFEPKKPCTGDPIRFRISVHNHGAVAAPPSKAAIKIGGGTPIPVDIPAVNPEEYKVVYFTKIIQVAQKYRVTVYADYRNNIREYNEGNNQKSKDFEVYANCCPDLVVTDNYVWIWPKNPKVGDKFDLRVRVFNNGLKKPLHHTTLKIYVGGSTTPHILNVSPIGPESERTFEKELSFSRPGKYIVRAVVDAENKVRECREDNNRGRVVFRVK